MLGFVAFWERTEYQARGACHGHALWWHANPPPDAFLDVIAAFANGVAVRESKDKERGGCFNPERAVEVANDLASCAPVAFVYVDGAPEIGESGLPVFKAEYLRIVGLSSVSPPEILQAVSQSLEAAAWYARVLDATSLFYDEAAEAIAREALGGVPGGHPSGRNLADFPNLTVELDYQDIRRETCRHTDCRKSYCLREKAKTKEVYCRFAAGLSIRGLGGHGETFNSEPAAAGQKQKEAARTKAPTHYFAELASAKDGTTLLRWRVYVGKKAITPGEGGEDPIMNSCSPSHLRIHRANCDAKPCIDKFGVCM